MISEISIIDASKLERAHILFQLATCKIFRAREDRLEFPSSNSKPIDRKAHITINYTIYNQWKSNRSKLIQMKTYNEVINYLSSSPSLKTW